MARKRMIDPDIWTDERFAFLSEGEQLLFIALFTQADDEGRFEWSALQFKLRCAPASMHLPQVFEDRKNAIVSVGLAYEFSVNGRVYLVLPGWFKTQKLERGAISKIPDPADLSTNQALSEYFEGLKAVREYQRKNLKNSDDQKMSENNRHSQPEEKRREEKRKEKKGSLVAPEAQPPFPEPIEAEVVAYLAVCASKNKTGAITDGRERSERLMLAGLRSEIGDDSLFLAALRESNRHQAPHENYIRRVAEGIARRGTTPPAEIPRREVHGYLNGEKCAVNSITTAPNGWSDAPPRGLRMADLWPEHKTAGVDYIPPEVA